MDKTLKGYICGTDIHDISLGANDVKIYSSIEDLKINRTCWEECGIIELDIKVKYVSQPVYYLELKEDNE